MVMFSTPNNSRKDVPCGYPKSFRRIYTGHTVKDVFHTQDANDRFIAVGNGVSYASTFTNGYWRKASVGGSFTSGCHLTAGDVEINIIIRDDGSYYISENGIDWENGGRISAEKYDRGWNSICAGPDCVVAVNNALPQTTTDGNGETVIKSNGLGAYGVYDPEQKKLVWADISLPFPSNKVRYFNEHFYIYGAILRNDIFIENFEISSTENAEPKTISQDFSVMTDDTEFEIVDPGAEIIADSVILKTIGIDGTESDYKKDVDIEVSNDTIHISLVESSEGQIFRIYYNIEQEKNTFKFSADIPKDQELKQVSVIQRVTDVETHTINADFFEKTDDGYTAVATMEKRDDDKEELELCCSCLNANIVSSTNYIAFSNNGADFEFVEEPLTEEVANEAAYGRGIYVAVTEEGRAIYSTQTPGRNWDFIDELEALQQKWRGVAFVAGMFVVCGSDEANDTTLYCSCDAKSWTQIPFMATASEDSSAITVTRLLSLMDLRGTLVALASSPISGNDSDVEYADERGFYVCDTFVSVEEGKPIVVNSGLNADLQKALERAIAVENTVRGFQADIQQLQGFNTKYFRVSDNGDVYVDAGRISTI